MLDNGIEKVVSLPQSREYIFIEQKNQMKVKTKQIKLVNILLIISNK